MLERYLQYCYFEYYASLLDHDEESGGIFCE